MTRAIVHIAIVVSNYDEAIDFYTRVMGFELIEDTPIPEENKRWMLVAPAGGQGTALLLAEPRDDHQASYIGNQAGGFNRSHVVTLLLLDWLHINPFARFEAAS